MSDGVNRIVPPSGTLERAGSISRERDGKNPPDGRRKPAEKPSPAVPPESQDTDELFESEKEKTKGKNIDINA